MGLLGVLMHPHQAIGASCSNTQEREAGLPVQRFVPKGMEPVRILRFDESAEYEQRTRRWATNRTFQGLPFREPQ